jgi:hypothetical protein
MMALETTRLFLNNEADCMLMVGQEQGHTHSGVNDSSPRELGENGRLR